MVWKSEANKLAVEVFVTHEVGPEKLVKLKQLNLACVEYDLSELPRDITYEKLKNDFENDCIRSKWVYNKKVEDALRKDEIARRRLAVEEAARKRKQMAEARATAVVRPVYVRQNSYGYDVYHVDPCPTGVRTSRGAAIANVRLDCRKCEYCFYVKWENKVPVSVRCGGHKSEQAKVPFVPPPPSPKVDLGPPTMKLPFTD